MRVFIVIFLAFIVLLAGVSGVANWQAEKKAPMLGSLIEVDGVPVHVLDLGTGNDMKAPVVLIHGASANLRDMKIALGDALATDRRVVMVDRSGRGYSGRPSDGCGYLRHRKGDLLPCCNQLRQPRYGRSYRPHRSFH